MWTVAPHEYYSSTNSIFELDRNEYAGKPWVELPVDDLPLSPASGRSPHLIFSVTPQTWTVSSGGRQLRAAFSLVHRLQGELDKIQRSYEVAVASLAVELSSDPIIAADEFRFLSSFGQRVEFRLWTTTEQINCTVPQKWAASGTVRHGEFRIPYLNRTLYASQVFAINTNSILRNGFLNRYDATRINGVSNDLWFANHYSFPTIPNKYNTAFAVFNLTDFAKQITIGGFMSEQVTAGFIADHGVKAFEPWNADLSSFERSNDKLTHTHTDL